MMLTKITVLVSAAFTPTATSFRQSNLLRKNINEFETFSSCTEVQDSDTCYKSVDNQTHEQCVWCDCQAVPSTCVSLSESKRLPPSVFECGSAKDSAVVAPTEFSFVEGYVHTIEDGEVDGNFCDPSSPRSLSGYMDITGSKYDSENENKHLFFWFFEKRGGRDDNTPTVIWLTGGPGCSSSMALLTENGPCEVNAEGTGTTVREHSWTETANVLWLDQPAGVGYSYGKINDKNEEMVGEDAYYFLQAFFQSHPEYAKGPLFITGESYGGHYVPAISHRVWKGNQDLQTQATTGPNTIHLNLKGIAIGNGLTDPKVQYKYYPDMAYNNSHGIKTVPKFMYENMKNSVDECIELIDQCHDAKSGIGEHFLCQEAYLFCNEKLTAPYSLMGLNPYDIRKKCEVKPLCYDFSNVESFMNEDSTREALHVSPEAPSTWATCNMQVHNMFTVDWMADLAPLVVDLLHAGIPVLVYAGDVDFICNYMGNRAWTLELEWDGASAFKAAEDHDWADGNGLVRSSGGLTFLQVYDAGHMVPSDKPEAALRMITHFLEGEEF